MKRRENMKVPTKRTSLDTLSKQKLNKNEDDKVFLFLSQKIKVELRT